MITIPTVLTYKDITVFPDDADCNLFYCIRTTPRIRMQGNTPVFSGLFYTDKADGTMETTSGIAGALINFDANLAISDEEFAAIRQEIKDSKLQEARKKVIEQKQRERQYYRNKVTDKDGKSILGSDPTGYNVPKVEDEVRFGSILYKEGTVELLEENNGDFVTWGSSGGRCSGFGDNNAAFSLRLSHLGGAVWYKALKEHSKAFSIRYNLTFEVRVPTLEIRIYAASHQHEHLERTWQKIKGKCGKADTYPGKSITKTLVDDSIINIEITQGSSSLPQEDINQIRESMMSILDKKIEEIFKSKIQGMTAEQMDNSMFSLFDEEINSFAEYHFTQDSVMDWSLAPQGTIMDFLEGVPKDALGRVVKLVDLADNEVATEEVHIQAAAPWDEAPYVTQVKVELEYVANGLKQAFLLSKDHPSEIWRFRKPKNDKGDVIYTAYIYTRDHKEPYVMAEEKTRGHVFINVGRPGVAELRIAPHPVISTLSGNNKVTSICVNTRYKTKGKDSKTYIDNFTISPDNMEGTVYSKDFGIALTEPLHYKVTYYFKNRAPIDSPEIQFYFTDDRSSQILTPAPFSDSLEIDVEASGKIKKEENIEKVIVTFRYEDKKNSFDSSSSVTLSKEDNWEPARASFVVMDKNNQKFQYKYTLFTKDDDPYTSDWIDGEGEAEPVIIPLPDIPMFNLHADKLKINVEISGKIKSDENFEKIIISFRYHDETNKYDSSSQVTLSKSNNWESTQASLDVMDINNQKFQYKYTLMMEDNDPYMSDWIDAEGKEETLIITAPDIPKANVLKVDSGLFGTLGTDYYCGELVIKFKKKEFPDLVMTFDSEENQKIRKWPIPERTSNDALSYSYTFNYTDMNGNEHVITGEKTGNTLVIPKPQKESESKAE
jgi:hypothetical protein